MWILTLFLQIFVRVGAYPAEPFDPAQGAPTPQATPVHYRAYELEVSDSLD